MIDFVKLELPPKYKKILENSSLLEFKSRYRIKTGEVDDLKEAEYLNMQFNVYDTGYIQIKGSLHKYYNKGLHNYNDFSLANFVEVIENLREKFGITPQDLIIRNIEFGVNIIPQINTTNLLNSILLHGNRRIKDIPIQNGNCKKALYSQYKVKIYDKSIKYGLEQRILRFELHFNKMQKLNMMGINTIKDLLNKDVLYSIRDVLNKEWGNILLYDETIEADKLKPLLKRKTLLWNNVNYWAGLSKQQKYRELKAYEDCISNYSQNTKLLINNMIKDKWRELTET